jgi:hypothetical protein
MQTKGEKMSDSKSWRDKAAEEIGKLCRAEYLRVNTTKAGKRRKKHVSYSVPAIAEELVECLETDNEYRAKQIFLYEL